MVVWIWRGSSGGERVDPEPAVLDLRAVPDGTDGLRMDTPPRAVEAAQFAYLDAAGAYGHPYREQESPPSWFGRPSPRRRAGSSCSAPTAPPPAGGSA